MKINIVGGGPAGLYFALLRKCAVPSDDITVYERNRADDTFGFGIVLSDETLANLRLADVKSYRSIRASFAYWDDLYTHFKGTVVRSTGHGFSGLGRLTLLDILRLRAEELGVCIRYGTEVADIASLRDADLLVGSDGLNSQVRGQYADAFQPRMDLRRNKFVWLGSTLPLPGFTYFFKENACGIWIAHAYQYGKEGSTVVVETSPEALERAGLESASEARTAAYLEDLFAQELGGHRLITNRSVWRSFPVVRCRRWSHENVVLLGDAAHTAHFSIGSGTKLALEGAIALHESLKECASAANIQTALRAYETTRREEVEKTQHAADVSLRWFETVPRYWNMHPTQFNFSLLSRSKQVTYENLRLRDPQLLQDIERWYAGADAAAPASLAPPMFKPMQLRDLQIPNRVVVSAMCQYSASEGVPNDWHLMHLGSRAVGGAGLLITEMTAVSAEARITPGCAGMYSEEHVSAWGRVVRFVHEHSAARICLQLGHAGRKGSTQLGWQEIDRPLSAGNWPLVSASSLPYFPESQTPRAATRVDMDSIRDAFVNAARMAERAGFDMIELHMAHGYLLASFLSPHTNRRTDEYGGALENRLRFPLEVFDAVRAAWPAHKPMSVRISAVDWLPGEALREDDAVEIARQLRAHGCDLIDVSSGQTAPESTPVYGRMFQTPFSEQIRLEAGIPTIAVGAITSADQVNTIIAAGRADLCALARPHLSDPYFTLRAAADYGVDTCAWPDQYVSAKSQLESQARRTKVEQQSQQARMRELQRFQERARDE
jgi:anthraniloyl-CoA monooxygenase